MALKDHSIDNRIIAAARKEFYEYGFTQASLRKIASRAEVTTGALYTRYKNKDELFEYLVSRGSDSDGNIWKRGNGALLQSTGNKRYI